MPNSDVMSFVGDALAQQLSNDERLATGSEAVLNTCGDTKKTAFDVQGENIASTARLAGDEKLLVRECIGRD